MANIIDSYDQYRLYKNGITGQTNYFHQSKKILMVTPSHFRIEYSINPYMKKDGVLQTVDTHKAHQQWHNLKNCYENLGFTVEILESQPNLPDMVFAANQSFPFSDVDGKPCVLMSNMHSNFRREEVIFFENWYRKNGYNIFRLPPIGSFEGNGDAIIHPGKRLIWGGFGHRTQSQIYSYIAKELDFNVIMLKLINPYFYHLDTCFSILDENTVTIIPEAFEPKGLEMIKAVFSTVITLDLDECINFFAGNCHCPDGRNVILNPGSDDFQKKLVDAGFSYHTVDTSEFMKSGGSVFCLKMQLP